MLSQISGQLTTYQMVSLLLGGCLTLFSYSIPAQAQIHSSGALLAQRKVFEALPPPPNLSPIPQNSQPIVIPQVQQAQTFEWGVSNVTPNQQPVQSSLYTQNSERYLVYVDSSQQLQRVRQIEPTAYVRSHNGRSVIQSGSFSKASNAQQRVRELESNGIRGAQIVSATNGQAIAYANPTASNNSNGNPRQQGKANANSYYVTIPAKSEQLNPIANQIRQKIGRYDIVLERQQPKGPHVAVGPFPQRSDAEEWNKYLRQMGFGDARVYYGK
ncbi:MAG: hypothetical protein KME23_25000 [Goleter apudmare HA4340-LM2]|jgi:hypothetical protein|nr:hypothetical protein [Goleter apudmare HA4340-LM2]